MDLIMICYYDILNRNRYKKILNKKYVNYIIFCVAVFFIAYIFLFTFAKKSLHVYLLIDYVHCLFTNTYPLKLSHVRFNDTGPMFPRQIHHTFNSLKQKF